MSDAARLYTRELLALSRHAAHRGRLEGATHRARGSNPLCGDRVDVEVRVVDGRVEAVRYEAKGCAIAQASAALMAQSLEGADLSAANERSAALQAALQSEAVELGPLEPLRAVAALPARAKCATLPWDVLLRALRQGAP